MKMAMPVPLDTVKLPVPRKVSRSDWKAVVDVIYWRWMEEDLDCSSLLAIIAEHCSYTRDNEGNVIAIRESFGSPQNSQWDTIVNALFCFLDSYSLSELQNVLNAHHLSSLGAAICSQAAPCSAMPPAGGFHNSRHIQKFFYFLKNLFNTNVITVDNQWFKEMAPRFQMPKERGVDIETHAFDFAMATWLMIQHCSSTREIRDNLKIFRESWPRQVDSRLSDGIYYSKMAVAEALDGNAELARLNLRTAHDSIVSINDPLTVIFLHDQRYVYFLIGNRENELGAIRCALCKLECFDTSANCYFVTQLTRMFWLYDCLCQLGIDDDLKVNFDVIPDAERIKAAADILSCFENTMSWIQGTDPRRMMVFYTCKARHSELTSSPGANSPVEYLREALKYAHKGGKIGKEIQHIEAYLNKVQCSHTDLLCTKGVTVTASS